MPVSSAFTTAHNFVAKWEGGLSDDAADRGGLTHWGVSFVFLSDFAKQHSQWLQEIGVHPLPVNRETIRNLTKDQAQRIFKKEFWDPLQLDDMPVQMACLLYDAAVNSGTRQSVKLAQRGYNAARVGTPLDVDGKYGPKTRAALLDHNTPVVWQGIIAARKNYYAEIVRKRPSQAVFLKGWHNRANDLLKFVTFLPRDEA